MQQFRREGYLNLDLQAEARRQGSGWVYVIDGRSEDPDSNVPSKDIVLAFEVRSGRIVRDSYLANEKWELLSDREWFQLGEGIRAWLLRILKGTPYSCKVP